MDHQGSRPVRGARSGRIASATRLPKRDEMQTRDLSLPQPLSRLVTFGAGRWYEMDEISEIGPRGAGACPGHRGDWPVTSEGRAMPGDAARPFVPCLLAATTVDRPRDAAPNEPSCPAE